MKLKKSVIAVREALRGCSMSHAQLENTIERNALRIMIIYYLNGLENG